jgi:GntR family transcriptional regulator
MGVSRSTLRTALLSLQKEGMLSRVRGRGTHVHLAALDVAANLTEEKAYLTLLSELGYRPASTVIGATRRSATPAEAGRLRVAPESEVLLIERVFLGDDSPLIYSTDCVPIARLSAPVEEISFETSTFRFLARWCGLTIAYSVAEIEPVVADERVAAVFRCPLGAPLLRLDHTHLTAQDEPATLTAAYFHAGRVRFSVVRTGVET